MPQFVRENAILGTATGAISAAGVGTTSGPLHPEQVVLRPTYAGLRLNTLPHLPHEKEIIACP